MKKTAFYEIHKKLGAKIMPFAGYEMPVQYQSAILEHQAVRNHAGLFDVSHMGEILIQGEKALSLIQKLTTNDASKLVDGKVQYSCMTNNNGGIIDDLLVYRFTEEKFLLVVNASNIEKNLQWINKNNTEGATVRDLSETYALIAVQGPNTTELLSSLTSLDLSSIPYYSFQVGEFAGCKNVLVSATGYTGAGGFELYINNEDAVTVWEAITSLSKENPIQPCGLAARDTLRLEMGYCLYGNDITEETTPLEAGLGWITKFSKEFTSFEKLKKQKEEGLTKRLVAFEILEKGIPRKDYEIFDEQNQKIGNVTSGTMSPTLKKGIGLGYVDIAFSKVGTLIHIAVRNKKIPATVSKLPFIK